MQHPRQFVHYEFQLVGGEDAQISRIVQSCEVAGGGGEGCETLCKIRRAALVASAEGRGI